MEEIWRDINEVNPDIYGKYLVATVQFGVSGQRFVYTAHWQKDGKGKDTWVVSDKEFWKYKFDLAFWTEIPITPRPDGIDESV